MIATLTEHKLAQTRTLFTVMMAIIVWTLLIWQHMNDGVPSHYLLHRKDYPSISNWWGGLILPLLSWILIGRINQRILRDNAQSISQHQYIIVGFVLAFVYGVCTSLTFAVGYPEITSKMFLAIFALAIFIKVHREECLLGFVLALSWVFGATISLFAMIIICLVSIPLHYSARYLWSRLSHIF